MKRKVMVIKNFAVQGERYKKGEIREILVDKIPVYKSEGFVEEVAVVLGLEQCDDKKLDDYAKKEHKHTEYVTLEQWKTLLDRIETLEAELTSIKEEAESTPLSEKTTTKKTRAVKKA